MTRDAYLRRTYGITEKQFQSILKAQGGKCPICLRTPKEVKRTFHVEHDHNTREIRGVACSYCNHRVIGRHRDPALLQRLADYIRGPGTGFYVPIKAKKRRKKRKAK